MNEDLKEKLKKLIEWNFGHMDDYCHALLDKIRKDEPNWVSDI